MSNSKRRCSNCRNYYPLADFYRGSLCSVACLLEYQQAARARKARRERAKEHRRAYRADGPSISQKKRVRRRDNERCRLCGSAGPLHCHHITYRSQQGPNEDWNLIALCDSCHHDKVHANKRRWQPLCRAYIWLLYVEGKQLTLPEIERRYATLSEQVA